MGLLRAMYRLQMSIRDSPMVDFMTARRVLCQEAVCGQTTPTYLLL